MSANRFKETHEKFTDCAKKKVNEKKKKKKKNVSIFIMVPSLNHLF